MCEKQLFGILKLLLQSVLLVFVRDDAIWADGCSGMLEQTYVDLPISQLAFVNYTHNLQGTLSSVETMAILGVPRICWQFTLNVDTRDMILFRAGAHGSGM